MERLRPATGLQELEPGVPIGYGGGLSTGSVISATMPAGGAQTETR